MSLLLYYFRRIYSLDTLDTRFAISSKSPVKANDNTKAPETSRVGVNDSAPSVDARARSPIPGARPSKWHTKEYYFYYFLFVTIVPLMFYVPYTVSRESDSQYPKFAPLLSPGWLFGRNVDNSDQQYASFRDNIPYMAIVVVLHPLLRKVFDALTASKATDKSIKPEVQADARLKQRIRYDIVFALIFIFVLHSFSALKILLILYINFSIGTKLPRSLIAPATWIFNITILFTNKWYYGYPYASMAAFISPFASTASTAGGSHVINWGSWLDSFGGLVPRWEILFNLTVLRLISFNMDYLWSLDQRGSSALEKKQLDPAALSERDRISLPAPTQTYSFPYYLAYTLYSPLYLTGPIISFNDFISQLRYPAASVTRTRTTLYAVRFMLTLLTMEFVLHFIYAVAISKSSPDWSHYTPFQLSMLGYFNLHIIWLKLLIPWRFFRLWALLDGVDPPENMVRCMSNNPSTLAFWRSWHRSFNRWIIRYLYIPVVTRLRLQSRVSSKFLSQPLALANYLVVFTFVAIWHDPSFTLLSWSWLIVLFLLPEVICSMLLFPAKRWRDHPERYRMLSGVGAVGNILMMMAANLVGFAIGVDGLVGLIRGLLNDKLAGIGFIVTACATLFVGVMVMFETREAEKRSGILLNC